MKAYGIFPMIDMQKSHDPRVESAHAIVTKLVCECLRADGDCFHVTVDWRNPNSEPRGICTEGIATPHAVSLSSREELQKLVSLSTDPSHDEGAAVIRSMATCRAATFGYDGQAFLCLRHEDRIPVSSDPNLVEVSERPDLLTEADYFDGVIASPGD